MNQRLSNPLDARAMRSRNAMREALLYLIKSKTLDQITIQNITDRAKVSYPTFFRQFSSKEGLLDDIAQAEIRELLALTLPLFNCNQQKKALQLLCGYIDKNRPLWTSLLTAGASGAMREEFMRIAGDIGKVRDEANIRANPWMPVDLLRTFIVAGMFEILAWWLQQPKDYPIENVILLLDVLVVRPTMEPQSLK
mgnify:CR=1 FL=1